MSPILKSLKPGKSLAFVLVCAVVLIGPINIIVRHGQASNNSLQHSLTPTVKESGTETGQQGKTTDEAKRARAREAYNKRALSFEENQGQAYRHVKYISRGAGYMLYLSPMEAVLTLRRSDGEQAASAVANAQSSAVQPRPHRARTGIVRMKLSGANPSPAIKGESRMAARAKRPGDSGAAQKRKADAAHYERVRYSQVYDGVDLIYYGRQQQLKYDFEVAAGADASRIVLEFGGVSRATVERRTGEVVLEAAGGEVRQRKPVAYQEAGGVRREVASRYVALNRNRVGIEVGDYDRTIPLVISSALSYAAYLGGNGQDSGATSSSASQIPDQSRKDQPVGQPTARYYSINGYVTDSYGYGIEGVIVNLDGAESRIAYTDYEGYYSFPDLDSEGYYTVAPSSDFYHFYPESQSFSNLAFHVLANFTALSGPLSISGYVTYEDGYGIEGAFVSLDGTDFVYTYTDYDGYYSFDGLQVGGDYFVYAETYGYTMDPSEQDFNNLQEDQENVNFTATYTNYVVSGKVTWDGQDVSGVGISLLLDGTEISSTSTDGYGAYAFYYLAAGNYTVVPHSDIFTLDPASQSVDLGSGGYANFTAQPHAVHSVSGRVTRSDGAGFSTYILVYGSPVTEFIETDPNGYYSFTVPAGGDYEVSVSSYVRVEPAQYNFNDLQSDQTGKDFKILPATISGRITNYANGAGLAGVTLTLTGEAAFTPRTVTTASNGAYSFRDVPTPDNYTIKPTLTDYRFSPAQLSLYDVIGDQTGQNFVGKARTFGITGVVRLGAARIPGVPVKLTSPGFTPRTVTTNSGGAYAFDNLPSGRSYTITPMQTGYQFTPASKSLASLTANQTGVDFAIKAYNMTGRITRSGVTTGIGAVTVTLTSPIPAGFAARTAHTDSTGKYTFTALPAGRNYKIKPTKTGFTFSPVTRSITNLSGNVGAGAATNFAGAGP